jgi:hypothetical protein
MARPKGFTKAKQKKWLEHVRQGMRPGAAAESMGLDRDVVLDFAADDEEAKAALAKAEREAMEHVEEALYQAAVSGNVTAARIWIDHRKPKSTAMVVASDEPDFDQELAELNEIAARGNAGT